MNEIIFSIIMPTYNSAGTIKYSLESIANQNFDLSSVECLVIDGGSTDDTIEIASKYPFVKILANEKRLPEYAKLIGYNNANGRYLITMDSDEDFVSTDLLTKRYNALEACNKDCHLLLANEISYKKAIGGGICGNYICCCGDPFTYFMYRQKGEILKTFKKSIKADIGGNAYLLEFGDNDIYPIGDGGTTTFDLVYIKDCFGDRIKDISFITSVFDNVMASTKKCLCIKDDKVNHRTKSTFKYYLKKIKFRVINNIFSKEESGFSSREISNGRKKLLFPLYTASFVLPLIDAVILSIRCKDIFMMLHIFYCYYTCFLIAKYMLLKICKINKSNKEY